MATRTIVVISTMVDATIKEYQPDTDFKLFRSIDGLAEFLELNPIRASLLFFTKDVVAASASAFSYLKDILTTNDYINVDRVIYITEEQSEELNALKYLIEECHLTNWEIIKGNLNRSFIQEVINGTFREDVYDEHRKVVIRRPRADYVKQRLKNMDSLDETYVDDDHDLIDIPDVELDDIETEKSVDKLRKVCITGLNCKERKAFSLLAAQYLSRTDKVLLIESDPEYHTITEYVTKSNIKCDLITVSDIYRDVSKTIERIRDSESNLVVVGCIERIPFKYQYILDLLYHNLIASFDYVINELEIDELPHNVPVTVVIPSTVTDLLATGEQIDKSVIKRCRFIGVDMKYLPEIHISSGVVMSKILNDILSETNIICPVITISSLRLSDTPYDLGGVLGKGVLL